MGCSIRWHLYPANNDEVIIGLIAYIARQYNNNPKIKIGITNNPERRWREKHKNDEWKLMDVIFKSQNHADVCVVERNLINCFKKSVRLFNMIRQGYSSEEIENVAYVEFEEMEKYQSIAVQNYSKITVFFRKAYVSLGQWFKFPSQTEQDDEIIYTAVEEAKEINWSLANERDGGGGRKPENGPYYVYVLVCHPL